MSDKPLEFHTDALAELKSGISWYLERDQIATYKFADEIDARDRVYPQRAQRLPNP